jgi:hypothetical protein
MAKTIKVPNVPAPTAKLCWKQAPNMWKKQAPSMPRCDRKVGHKGPHTWEFMSALARIGEVSEQLGAEKDTQLQALRAENESLEADRRRRFWTSLTHPFMRFLKRIWELGKINGNDKGDER